MGKQKTIKLIDGQFKPSEAKSILFALINSKINFHSMESFGITVRSSGDVSHHEKRIKELRATNAEVKNFLDNATKSNQEIVLHGNIEIELVNAKKRAPKKVSK